VIDRCEHMECGICEVCALERASGPAAEVAGPDFGAVRAVCSLCGKAAPEVRHMIAGLPGGFVCDECIEQALPLLVAKGWRPPTIQLEWRPVVAADRLRAAVEKLLSVVSRDAHAIEGVTEAVLFAEAFVNGKDL